VDVAAVLFQLALDEEFNVRPLFAGQPAALDEQRRQRSLLAGAPGGAGFGEAVGVKEIGLQSQHAEKEVAVCRAVARRRVGHS
jgi:hypothetical protein